MKPYLVDVPVRVNIWIRPECQRRQFEVLKEARPSILFLISDGGRNEKEWEAINGNRAMFDEEVDWECTIYKMYEDKNNGLYTMGKKMSELVWSKVDRCIFLEDDILPSISFFRYCSDLLERYKDDLRVSVICGFNHLGVYDDVTSDYFFSRQGAIWGTATWKRTFDLRDSEFKYGSDPYTMKLLEQRTKHNRISWKRIQAYTKQKYYEGHVAGGEFWHEFNMYGHNQLQIVPKKNLISNIGCTENSFHADKIDSMPRGIRCVFNSKTYELEFPLKHNDYIIPDVYYEKKRNRIMGYNHPVINAYRKMERLLIKIKHGDFKYIVRKLMQRIKGNSCVDK